MPVASFVATGTASGRLSVAACAGGPAFLQRSEKRRSRHPSPQAPHPFPSALLSGEESGTRGAPPIMAGGAVQLEHFQIERHCVSDHTVCRCAEKMRFFSPLWAGRRCATASQFTFFKGKTFYRKKNRAPAYAGARFFFMVSFWGEKKESSFSACVVRGSVQVKTVSPDRAFSV